MLQMAIKKNQPAGSPKLLYIASDDWFFLSHFAHLATAAQAAGYQVVLAARISNPQALARHGIAYIAQEFDRSKRSIFRALRLLPSLVDVLQKVKPDLIHIIGLQNIIFIAPFAALFSQAKIILAPIGLGQFWVESDFLSRCARSVIRALLWCLRGPRFFYLFENDEDSCELGLQNYPRKITVGGAGIDEAVFAPLPFPTASPLRVAIVARMLRSKGILQAVNAIRSVRQDGWDIELDLWGAPDPANLSSLTEDELRALSSDGITWRGATSDINGVWKRAHIAMLLSTREGLSKSLLEAAACGRPMIVNDAPGCRTFVRDGQEGFLVNASNPQTVVSALLKLAQDPALREKMGAAARLRVLQGFTQKQVASSILPLYSAALSNRSDKCKAKSAAIAP
jgi:glycosyltransferase involved in cell wall biosynthesis